MELTHEQKMALCEDYKSREKTVKEIAAKYGIKHDCVARIAVEMGAAPRRKKMYGQPRARKDRVKTARVCPKCRKTIDVKGASFCCFCGTDIRSSKELLIERVKRSMPTIMHLPANMRDDMQRLLLDIIKELEGEMRNNAE